MAVLFAVLPAMGDGGAVANNILGGFGIEFDVPVATNVLGASVGPPPPFAPTESLPGAR